MTNLLSSPSEYKYNIYDIYILCDRKTQKTLFCLNKAWSQDRERYENYFRLRHCCSLANKRISVLKSFLSIYINDEKTGTPFDFDSCRTFEEVDKSFRTIFSSLKKLKLDPYQLLVASHVPVLPKIVFSSEVKNYQLDKIPAELVMAFRKCVDLQDPKRREKELQNLAKILLASNEGLFFIFVDLVNPLGYSILVMREYLFWLVANRKFEQAWNATERLVDGPLKQEWFNFIVDQQTKQAPLIVSIPSPTALAKRQEARCVFQKCEELNRKQKYEESLQYLLEIKDPAMRLELLSEIVVGLNDLGNIKRAHEIIEKEEDPYCRFHLYKDIYQEDLDDNKFETLKQAVLGIKDQTERLEAFSLFLDILDEDLDSAWHYEIDLLHVQQLIDLAMAMDEGPKRDITFEKICSRLIHQGNYKDAFEYSDNIEKVEKQSTVRLQICQLLKKQNKFALMQQVLDSIQDLSIRQQAYEAIFQEQLLPSTEGDAELIAACHQLRGELKYERAFKKALDIRDESQRMEVLNDILSDLDEGGEFQQAHRLITTIKEPHLRFYLYKNLYAPEMNSSKFKDLINAAQQIGDEEDRMEAFLSLLNIADRCRKSAWYNMVQPLCAGPLSNKIRDKVQILLDQAMQMDEGIIRDKAFKKICALLLVQGKDKEAFEYSDNIEDVEMQSKVRRSISRRLKEQNKFERMQQVLNSIPDASVKQWAYKELFPEKQAPSGVQSENQAKQQAVNLKNQWYQMAYIAEKEAQPKRDQLLFKLAQEAKQNGWFNELNDIVAKIEDLELMASCF